MVLCAEQSAVDAGQTGDAGFGGVAFADEGLGAGDEATGEVWVAEDAGHGGGEGGDVAGLDEEGAFVVGDDFRDAADGGGDGGDRGDHGFEEGVGGAFAEGGEDGEIGDGVEGFGGVLVAGEGDAGREVELADEFFDAGAFGAIADDEQVGGEGGGELVDGAEEGEVVLFAREAADDEDDLLIGGDVELGAEPGGGVGLAGAPVEADGVVDDFDAGGGDAAGDEFVAEGLADGEDFGGGGEGPAVELVVEAGFEVGPGVAVVEGDPGGEGGESGAAGEEVGFDGVGLDDVGLEALGECVERVGDGGVEGAAFGDEFDGDAEGAGGFGEEGGGGVAGESGDGGVDAEGGGEAGEFEEIFGGAGDGIGLEDGEEAERGAAAGGRFHSRSIDYGGEGKVEGEGGTGRANEG